MLGVGSQPDAPLQLLHGVDVVHPLGIHVFQQNHPLQLSHQGRAENLLPVLINSFRFLINLVDNVIGFQIFHLGGSKLELIRPQQPSAVVVPQALQIPILLGRFRGQIGFHPALHRLAQHFENLLLQILAVQHLIALGVNDLALAVHHVVVLEHVFPDAEVSAFHLALGAFDGVGKHLVFDGDVFLHIEPVHNGLHPVAAEQAHQVILHGQVEPGGARVSLTAGTASQLVVDPAGLVALGAHDEQAARLPDLLRLGLDSVLIFLVQLLEGPSGV